MMPKRVRRPETKRPIMRVGTAISVDVMIYAWERKFVYCSVDT